MRAMLTRFLAAGTIAAVALGGAVAPAQAEVTEHEKGHFYSSETGTLTGATIQATNKDLVDLTWRSVAGVLLTRLESFVYLNDVEQHSTPDSVRTWREGTTDIVEMRSVDREPGSNTGIEVVRTLRLDGTKATIDVTLRNTTSRTQKLQVDLQHAGTNAAPAFTIESDDGALVTTTDRPDFTVNVDFVGNPQSTGFSGGGKWADAPYGKPGVKGYRGIGGARYQGGRWFSPLKPGDTFTGSMTVTATPAAHAVDVDRDGIPDEWERDGYTPAGTSGKLDLPAWGASPDQPDVFLQLNWMEPEVDSKSCAPGGRFARSTGGYSSFLECAEANKNEYRPSKKALKELVDLFADNGVRLHIDAGSWFNTFTNDPAEMKGGPTVKYKFPYYDSEAAIKPTLEADRMSYLGDRASVFRLGIIGDRFLDGDHSSGVSSTPGGSFYVAKQSTMTSDDQVRNTILHELGHNLGLTHGGTYAVPANRNLNNLPNYLSTMNYLYQFSHFGYSDKESRSGGVQPPVCAVKYCYSGSYVVPADWQNLLLAEGLKGHNTPDAGDIHHEDSTVRDLEVNAADKNSGKGGFRLTEDHGHRNGIIPALPDNHITGEISNLGREAHTFILEATYPGGAVWRERFRVEGIPHDLPAEDSTEPTAGKRRVSIPLQVKKDFAGASLPVTIRLYNEGGVQQYNETLSIPVLDYNSEELSKVLEEVLADPNADPKVKEAARETAERLKQVNSGGGNGNGNNGDADNPIVRPSLPNKPETSPLAGSSSKDGSGIESGAEWKIPLIVLGSLLGLLGLGAAAQWFLAQSQNR